MDAKLIICKRCILDSDIPNITFDENGICNYCKLFEKKERLYPNDERGLKILEDIVYKIKESGKNKKYDCIVGVSGGVDSSYSIFLAKKMGLRPLAVHIDNGWNSELAINNIKNLLDKNGIDLITYVVDWDEFKNLQLSFLRASVSDTEQLTDQAIITVLYKTALRNKIEFIIHGGNFRTEGTIPRGWSYWDIRYFKSINRKFGKTRVKTYTYMSALDLLYCKYMRRIKIIPLLNYVNYNKNTAINILKTDFDWQNYEGKHYESIFTRWFQSYLLPKKFSIDKRKIHYSALIRSGQLTREKALLEIKKPPYPLEKIKEDCNYVKKKLGLSSNEFDYILNLPKKTFLDYPSYYSFKSLTNNFFKYFGFNLQQRP